MKKGLTIRLMLWIAAIIISTSLINLFWSMVQYEQQAQNEMKEKASVIAQQLLATRTFIAEKQDIINYDQQGNFHFKQLNPAAVGKGVGSIFGQYTGYQLKQTRLEPRAEENMPDQYEAQQLESMQADSSIDEIWSNDVIDGQRVFRYMLPMYYSAECMPCHGGPAGEIDIAGFPKEGGNVGELAGAISIVFSSEAFEKSIADNLTRQVIFSLIVLLLTIGGVYIVMSKIVIHPLKLLTQRTKDLGQGDWDVQINPEDTYDEMRHLGLAFNTMANRLQDTYINLEEKIKERTALLLQANLQLSEQSAALQHMNERLSEADRLKSEFLVIMSHELKTPLTAIIAFTELLLTEQTDPYSQDSEYLNDILESAYALRNQIDDILDMSKIEVGLVELECHSFYIEQVFEDLLFTFNPLFAQKKTRFITNISPETPMLYADYSKVKHIIQNLLSNALKFTKENGCITVDVAAYHGADFEGVVVSVSDDGVGINPNDMQSIFEKFWKSDSGDHQYSGSGLGLAIAKNYVELHGGNIQVHNRKPSGAIFTFVLPLMPEG